jgi:DsbC/DsbD-like thiol-disulfide interchange protein
MRKFTPIALILSMLGTMSPAQSLDGVAQLDVLPGWETRNGTHMAGLRITLAPGWKTYWRAAGDAGIPPMFSWAGSENIKAAQFHWPVPDVFHQQGMRSIGYYEGVVLPVELTPSIPGIDIHIAGEISIGVCEEICIPMTLAFDAQLPKGGTRDAAITASLINQPLSANEAGVQNVSCQVDPTESGLLVIASFTLPVRGTPAVVIEAGDPYVWVSEPKVTQSGNQITAMSRMVHRDGVGFALDRSALRITVIGDNQAVDIKGCAAG